MHQRTQAQPVAADVSCVVDPQSVHETAATEGLRSSAERISSRKAPKKSSRRACNDDATHACSEAK